MTQNQQTMIERLRQLKQANDYNNKLISNLKIPPLQSVSGQGYQQYQPMNTSQQSGQQSGQQSDSDLYSKMMNDFETRNKHIIESQLYYERSQDLLNDVLSMVDNYDEDELNMQLSKLVGNTVHTGSQAQYDANSININNFDSVSELVNAIPKKDSASNQIKKVYIQPQAAKTTQIEHGPELTDLTEYEQELVGEFVDTAYTHLIKVLKVYFILADGKYFRLPATSDILTMKLQLEGHTHVPDIDVIKGHIRAGTHIYYLTIDENSHVKLLDGYVLKTANTGIVIIDEENNKKKHIDFKCPIFRKINNLDIAIFIKKKTENA